ncbi:MAG TPA: HD domain-containing phosphohydrolase [Abditibacteriaceae bacterium]|jgi:putative two-component system response regulator
MTSAIQVQAEVILKNARVLIVDDEPINVRLLQRILQNAGYHDIACVYDSREVLSFVEGETPDIVLLDWMMPHLNGLDVLRQLQHQECARYLPILVLTADVTAQTREEALAGGAKDFLTKPFDQAEVLLRVKNLLETRFLHLAQQEQNRSLEERVLERTRDLENSQAEMLQRLAQAAEFRDDDTGQHTQRVGELAGRLAAVIGLDADTIALIRRAAPLHDVGKIGISDAILLKPGKLSPEEFVVMKTHAQIGAALLKDGHSPLVQIAETIAFSHHERWDGGGYPQGLRGEEIPIEGRILAIVDVFDALTNERPYKKAWSVEQALEEIERNAGTQFDPAAVAAFLQMMRGE